MEMGKPVRALSPTGMLLTFKRDMGMTGGMPYMDMNNPKEYVDILQKLSLIVLASQIVGLIHNDSTMQVILYHLYDRNDYV